MDNWEVGHGRPRQRSGNNSGDGMTPSLPRGPRLGFPGHACRPPLGSRLSDTCRPIPLARRGPLPRDSVRNDCLQIEALVEGFDLHARCRPQSVVLRTARMQPSVSRETGMGDDACGTGVDGRDLVTGVGGRASDLRTSGWDLRRTDGITPAAHSIAEPAMGAFVCAYGQVRMAKEGGAADGDN